MWISYLGVFICVLSAYDVYEKKKDCPVYLTYNTTGIFMGAGIPVQNLPVFPG